MKIVTVVGARPQFVKAAVVSRALRKRESVQELIIHTGQHFDKNMSDIFFEEMDIPKPDFSLGINSMTHAQMTGHMLIGIEEILLSEKPDFLLVYGDTNSTLAGALAASKIHIPVAHVEAGLRSFNMRMPEEINRILTDKVSNLLFCPTITAVDNLRNEGVTSRVKLSGDVMLDAALYYQSQSKMPKELESFSGDFILATIHREENTSDQERLSELINTLNHIHQYVHPVIVPIHPGTRKKIENFGFEVKFKTLPPVSYFEMIGLLERSKLVLTDSGGLQKEAFFFNKFCVTLRDQTEWVELIKAGVNITCGTNKGLILDSVNEFLNSDFPVGEKLYGNGDAGEKIVDELTK